MKGKLSSVLLVFLTLIIAAGAFVLVLLNEREKPEILIESDVAFMGKQQEITLTVKDQKSGIRSLSVFLEQGGHRFQLAAITYDRQGYFNKGGENVVQKSIMVEMDKFDIRDGRADLVVRCQDFSFWNFMNGNVSVSTVPVIVDTANPKLRVLDSPRYINAGGSSIVIYRVNEPVVSHGAVINGHFYPGFPASEKDDQVFGAMLSLEYDAVSIDDMYVTAADRAGNSTRTQFSMILRKLRPNKDRIPVSDRFLNRKIPEFSQNTDQIPEGDALDKYLFINRRIRQDNNARIRSICSTVSPQKMWKGHFKRLPRSSRRAGFADYRTYYYKKQKIDNQVHLGVDLASVRRANVPAANAGKVAFADYLGIYGNMVIIDHGWGLYSLYSHLSEITVSVGDAVAQGDIVGRTGSTGMAGGDHLHYGMLVNGIFVNPLEWWDRAWLKLNILSFL